MTEPLQTYEPAKFEEKLADVQRYLGDLRYIDAAEAYLEGEQASRLYQTFDTPLTGQSSHLEVRFDTAFPFVRHYRLPEDFIQLPWEWDEKKREVESQLQVLAAEAADWAATEVEGIASLVKPFLWPVRSLYQSECIGPVEQVHGTLDQEVSGEFEVLGESLSSWDGEAAKSFRRRFYRPFKGTLRSQKKLLLALAGGITTAKLIAEATQDSLMNVVHGARHALRDQLEMRADQAEQDRKESLRTTLIVAAGAATAFTGLVTGGASLWLAAAAGGATMGSAMIPSNAWNEIDLHGATATELLSSMSNAIDQIERNDGQQHERLRREVEEVIDRVKALWEKGDEKDGRLIPIRPKLVDGVDASDFHHAKTGSP